MMLHGWRFWAHSPRSLWLANIGFLVIYEIRYPILSAL